MKRLVLALATLVALSAGAVTTANAMEFGVGPTVFTSVRTGTAIITSGTTTTTATAGSSLHIGPIALARTSKSADAFAIDPDG